MDFECAIIISDDEAIKSASPVRSFKNYAPAGAYLTIQSHFFLFLLFFEHGKHCESDQKSKKNADYYAYNALYNQESKAPDDNSGNNNDR